MKCPNCGAEVTGNVCEYCGSIVKRSNKATCPECGSQNIKFDREKQGYNMRIPVGVCRDCGYSWDLRSNITQDMQYKIFLLFFGFVFCFPVPATYLLWKATSLSQKTKYVLIGLVWAVYLGFFILPPLALFLF